MAVVGPWRVSFYFSQQADRLGGWSENFWNNQSSVDGVTAAATTLQNALYQLKGFGVDAPYIRISQVGNFRSAFVINTLLQSTATGAPNDADFPTNAILFRLNSTQPYFNNQWLRGIWDNVVSKGGHYIPTAGWTSLFNSFMSQLTVTTNGWVTRNLNQTNLKQLITAVTLAGVVTVPTHGYITGQQIRISRTGGIVGLNKIWKIVKIDNDTFSLVAPPAGGFSGAYTKPGTAQLQAYLYQSILGSQNVRASKHNTGRPFGQLTGRRRRPATSGS